jgi:hypothetical protein
MSWHLTADFGAREVDTLYSRAQNLPRVCSIVPYFVAIRCEHRSEIIASSPIGVPTHGAILIYCIIACPVQPGSSQASALLLRGTEVSQDCGLSIRGSLSLKTATSNRYYEQQVTPPTANTSQADGVRLRSDMRLRCSWDGILAALMVCWQGQAPPIRLVATRPLGCPRTRPRSALPGH